MDGTHSKPRLRAREELFKGRKKGYLSCYVTFGEDLGGFLCANGNTKHSHESQTIIVLSNGLQMFYDD